MLRAFVLALHFCYLQASRWQTVAVLDVATKNGERGPINSFLLRRQGAHRGRRQPRRRVRRFQPARHLHQPDGRAVEQVGARQHPAGRLLRRRSRLELLPLSCL